MLGNRDEHRHGLCVERRWGVCVRLGQGRQARPPRWRVPAAFREGGGCPGSQTGRTKRGDRLAPQCCGPAVRGAACEGPETLPGAGSREDRLSLSVGSPHGSCLWAGAWRQRTHRERQGGLGAPGRPVQAAGAARATRASFGTGSWKPSRGELALSGSASLPGWWGCVDARWAGWRPLCRCASTDCCSGRHAPHITHPHAPSGTRPFSATFCFLSELTGLPLRISCLPSRFPRSPASMSQVDFIIFEKCLTLTTICFLQREYGKSCKSPS